MSNYELKGLRLSGKWNKNAPVGSELLLLKELAEELKSGQFPTEDDAQKAVVLAIFDLNHCETSMNIDEFQDFLASYGWLGNEFDN